VFQTLMEALDPAGLGWELDLEVGGRLTVSTNGEPRLTMTAAGPLNTWTYVTLRRSGATWPHSPVGPGGRAYYSEDAYQRKCLARPESRDANSESACLTGSGNLLSKP